MIPFSNGTQYLDWSCANCDRCTKATTNGGTCEILEALTESIFSDGQVSDSVAQRMGINESTIDLYNWPCNEIIFTEEWKIEYTQRKSALSQRNIQDIPAGPELDAITARALHLNVITLQNGESRPSADSDDNIVASSFEYSFIEMDHERNGKKTVRRIPPFSTDLTLTINILMNNDYEWRLIKTHERDRKFRVEIIDDKRYSGSGETPQIATCRAICSMRS